jgi:hypothetical protein
MRFHTTVVGFSVVGSFCLLFAYDSIAANTARETVMISLAEISPDKSIPIVDSSALNLDASGNTRWGVQHSGQSQVGSPKQEGGWETELNFEPDVDLDQVSIPIRTNDPEALRSSASRVFSALGMIPIVGLDVSSQIRNEDLTTIEQIGVDFFDRLVFVYGPQIPTAVLVVPKNGEPVRVTDVDSAGIHLPLSSIVELTIGLRQAFVVSPDPELFTSKRPAVAKVPVMVWSDVGERVVGKGWTGALVNEYSTDQNQLIVSSNIGYLDDLYAMFDAVDCGSKHYQLSLLDPRSRDPAVLQIQVRLSYHSQKLMVDGLSLDLYPAHSFHGSLLCCEPVLDRNPPEFTRFGEGRWNDSRTHWTYSGTPEGYFRASWEASRAFWQNLADFLSSNELGIVSMGQDLSLALSNPSLAKDGALQNTSVPRELGAFTSGSVVTFIRQFATSGSN